MRAFKRIRIISQEARNLIESQDRSVIVADIGADHGYISEQLARLSHVEKVIATDISQKCLDKVNKLKEVCNYDKIETELGDGLNAIEKADLCVIAGIGGNEIRKMLESQNMTADGEKCETFILQPSEDVVLLRKWLYKTGYIIKDYIFECLKRFYSLIVFTTKGQSKQRLSKFAKYFGKDTCTNSLDFKNYLCYIKENLEFVASLTERQKKSKNCRENYELYTLACKFLDEIGGKNVRKDN